MPRFVILEHDHPHLHWDLMLECGAVLRTWRLASPPRPGETIAATAVFDHRLLYLDYEGSISGGRGRVARWEHGTFTGDVRGDQQLVVQLSGERLQGLLLLEHTEGEDWRVRLDVGEGGSQTLAVNPSPA